MNKFILVIICFFISTSICAQQPAKPRFEMARLHYGGGGDWYNNADVLPNLADYINKELKTNYFVSEETIIKASDTKIFNYPFIYLTGHGNIKFSNKEITAIRTYLAQGGFIYADDDYGLDKSLRAQIKRLYPEYELQKLAPTHPLFSAYYTFYKGLPKIHEHDKKRPQAFGIFDDQGRLLILYTYESNISDGWASPAVHKDPPDVREKALQFGLNIIYYIMTR